MALPSTTDVLVIGGGPAGASVARELASLGHRVVVLTRPAAKPSLAETIPPSTHKLLQRLGWLRDVEAVGFVRTTGNTVLWSGAQQMHAARYEAGSLGFQVDRAQLNDLFLDGLKRSACAVIEDASVTAAHDGVLRFIRGERAEEIAARWIIDCSGRSGVIARQGWRRGIPGLRTLAIVGVWERTDGWAMSDVTHTLVESYAGGWAWSVPVSALRRHVTVMVDPRLSDIRAHGALADTYRAELQRVPELWRLTQGAQMVATPFARDASPYAAHQVAATGVLLVGDAATFVDPLSSFGIKKALASAWLAAVVVNTCLCDSAMESAALAFYEARERAMYDALERRRTELAQSALGEDAKSDFWLTRAGSSVDDEADPNEHIDVEAARVAGSVRRAFDELKRRESIRLVASGKLQYVQSAAVQDSRVVMQSRLRLDGSRRAVRFLRNVDLVVLSELAPRASQVPDLYEAYCQRVAPAPLPDFLGALAFLIAEGFLEFA